MKIHIEKEMARTSYSRPTLQITNGGEISAGSRPTDGVSPDVWTGRTIDIPLPDYTNPTRLEQVIKDNEFVALAQAWIDITERDQGTRQDEICETIYAIDAYIERYRVYMEYSEVWESADYIAEWSTNDWAEYGGPVTADTTDAEIKKIAAAITEDIPVGTYIIGDFSDALEDSRHVLAAARIWTQEEEELAPQDATSARNASDLVDGFSGWFNQ